MIDVMVTRGAGDLRAEDVVDPLIGSIPTAISRGRAVVDASAERMKPVTITAVYRDGLRNGQLLRVNDSIVGTWSGQLVSITHRATGGEEPWTESTIRVERRVAK